MAVNATALVTLSEAKAFLSLTSDAFDADIERRINGLTAAFERESNRKIKQQTLTDYRVDGNGRTSMLLPFIPTQAVTKVQIRYWDETIYKTITDTSKFVLADKNLGILRLLEDVFIRGSRNVLISMSVGYLSTDNEYGKLQELLLLQLKFDWKKWDQNEIGQSARSLADGNLQFIPTGQFLREVSEGLMLFKDRKAV